MTNNHSSTFSAIHILIYLRQSLLDAVDQNDVDTLHNLARVFDMLWDFVDKEKIHGGVGRILENLGNAAREYARGIGWKSIIPSEEEIRSALQNEQADR